MAFFKKLKNEMVVGEEAKINAEDKETPKTNPPSESEEKLLKKEVEVKKEEEKKEEEKKEKDAGFSGKKSSEWLKTKGQLAVDVYETDLDFWVQAPIAGVSQEDLDISVENEMLLIKGERKEPTEKESNRRYFYQECYWGPFSRQIILPEDADVQKIKASLKSGILTIRIPRLKAQKKKVVVEIEG